MNREVLVVIPARFASTRFPGKPLAELAGKPVIRHVLERVRLARCGAAAIVATDDERIFNAVKGFGGEARMTDPAAATGSDRVAEVARAVKSGIVINVQGDEPLIRPEMVDQLAEYLAAHPDVPMASLMRRRSDTEGLRNPDIVKVVTDGAGFALYFSRAPIPHARDAAPGAERGWFHHIGIYGFQRDFLLRYPSLPETPLAAAEKLEQLRALENGHRIAMLETPYALVGVDRPEDLERAAALLAAEDLNKR